VRLAILSDIHSNLEALEEALAEVERLRIDRMVSCGDLVGYNADPNAVVNLVRDLGILSVMGNHDAAACGLEEPLLFNPAARAAILWTRDVLTPENRQFLRDLPVQAEVGEGILLVHGSIVDRDRYLDGADAAREDFEALDRDPRGVRIAFFGHTHCPVALCSRRGEEEIQTIMDSRIHLKKEFFYLVNGGSVGQPRDGDPQLSFAVADVEEGWVERYRLPYAVEVTAGKVEEAGLPGFLARRLLMGH
jgi:predicted phosphodiesterase